MTGDFIPKALPFFANFAAGAIAGVSEILTFYPLDVVKTRMQLSTEKSQGFVGTFKNIVKEEGAGRLYRGLVPPLLLEAPKRAVKFAANDFWGEIYLDLAGEKKMNQQLSILTGCSAGATFVIVYQNLCPRLQDKNSTYAGPIDVVKQIIKKEGILGMYNGMESTFWRHLWWNGGYFGCIFQVRAMLPEAKTQQATLFNNFVSGAVGGCVGTMLNTPSVVKSRIQSAPRIHEVSPKYNWTYPSLVLIAREEGIGALYKGFIPKVLRLAPGGGVLLLVVEFTLGIFRQALGPPYI
ncbi:mitochondrial carrier domain-containing protein [Lentinula aciculospora]|uniref:Mitochondrial carrier domain-containing protein n=1 Tax=Lentinula aciculospora TaxID=153920 RepID=A0A9W9AWV4_9AGAR|nr:mitochondrial carrier domain-containing protein [Lentinula aciculospora]